MSVDANVLIFERIREEQERGSSLANRNRKRLFAGLRTIFDSNITTFLTAFILYVVASEEIKGFAIVLMLGIISSLFTAIFVTRFIFDWLTQAGVIRDHLVMLRLVRNPRINWMGLHPYFLTISLILIAAGLFAFVTRDETKNSKYDIEFTGGTSVQITLEDETMTRDEVEKTFQEQARRLGNNDLAAAKVYRVGDTGAEYEITTTETNKTRATVTFDDTGRTIASVRDQILKAAEQAGGTLYNLQVTTDDNTTFDVSTSQANRILVARVLNDAFGETARISEPVVDEVVSRAVREAFAGKLKARQDLAVRIVAEEKIAENVIELADYLGGIKLTVEVQEPVTAGEIRSRIRELRFKPDAEDLAWYPGIYSAKTCRPWTVTATVKRFVYVTVYPEAGYRELAQDEWDSFASAEKDTIERAGSLETALARITQIDPSVGSQAKTRAVLAVLLSLAAIVVYIWIRFGTAGYGIAAILALVHDVCIVLGAVTVSVYLITGPLAPVGNALLLGDFKIDLQMIAAFLTIIGYSLNDTIVIFDRMRENRGKLAALTPQIVNDSINQTLSRTLLTSLTTFLAVFIMV